MKKTWIAITALFLIISAFTLATAQPRVKKPETFTAPLGSGFSLSMVVIKFEPNAHKITKCKILDWEGICLIDGKPFFGTDWGLPQSQLVRASLKVGSASIKLDVSCMYNPWSDKPRPENFSIEETEGGYLVRGSFSDGAGTYDAEWFIINNASVRTHLAKSGY